MNPFTTIPTAIRTINRINWFSRHIKQFDALRDAGDIEAEQALIAEKENFAIARINEILRLTYTIIGEENVPKKGPFMVYINHQGLADIPAVITALGGHQIGFIAKNEFKKTKFIANAIAASRSLFLNRQDARDAVRVITEASEMLHNGYNLAIFPEGTRAKCSEMGEFKPGSFKFAQRAKVPILPISLDGTYKMLEETGSFRPTHVYVKIHPIVHIEEMDKKEQQAAFVEIEETIRRGVSELVELSKESENK